MLLGGGGGDFAEDGIDRGVLQARSEKRKGDGVEMEAEGEGEEGRDDGGRERDRGPRETEREREGERERGMLRKLLRRQRRHQFFSPAYLRNISTHRLHH